MDKGTHRAISLLREKHGDVPIDEALMWLELYLPEQKESILGYLNTPHSTPEGHFNNLLAIAKSIAKIAVDRDSKAGINLTSRFALYWLASHLFATAGQIAGEMLEEGEMDTTTAWRLRMWHHDFQHLQVASSHIVAYLVRRKLVDTELLVRLERLATGAFELSDTEIINDISGRLDRIRNAFLYFLEIDPASELFSPPSTFPIMSVIKQSVYMVEKELLQKGFKIVAGTRRINIGTDFLVNMRRVDLELVTRESVRNPVIRGGASNVVTFVEKTDTSRILSFDAPDAAPFRQGDLDHLNLVAEQISKGYSPTETPRERGTGMRGSAVLLAQAGGRLEIVNRGVAGTTTVVTLPIANVLPASEV